MTFWDQKTTRTPVDVTQAPRSNAHLYVGLIMFALLVVAGVSLTLSGRSPETIIATLSFYSATGIGIVTAIVKLSSVEQTANTVERRTSPRPVVVDPVDIRAIARDEIHTMLTTARAKSKGDTT